METNLAVCPPSLITLDPNAEKLWPVLLRRVGLHFNAAREVIENDSHRAEIVRKFAVASLEQRLPSAKDERARARIWWRESIAASDGAADLPDLDQTKLHVLNPFIVSPELKYHDPRKQNLRRGRKTKEQSEKRATNALRQQRFRESKKAESVTL